MKNCNLRCSSGFGVGKGLYHTFFTTFLGRTTLKGPAICFVPLNTTNEFSIRRFGYVSNKYYREKSHAHDIHDELHPRKLILPIYEAMLSSIRLTAHRQWPSQIGIAVTSKPCRFVVGVGSNPICSHFLYIPG